MTARVLNIGQVFPHRAESLDRRPGSVPKLLYERRGLHGPFKEEEMIIDRFPTWLEGRVENGKVLGGYNEHMGHGTSFSCNGHEIEDDGNGNLSFPVEVIRIGSSLSLGIPSGDLDGVVGNIILEDGVIRIRLDDCCWEGKEAGLTGGHSCLFRFRAEILGGVVISSTLLTEGEEIPYEFYAVAKNARYMFGNGEDEIARELIAKAVELKGRFNKQ